MGKEEEIKSGIEPEGQIQKVSPEAPELVWMISRERHTKQN